MAAQQGINDFVAPNLDMVLQNEAVDEVLGQFLKDTQEGLPSDDMASVQGLELAQNAESTDQLVAAASQQLTAENLFGFIVEVIPEDSPVNDWFGWFISGDKNDGNERMGAREDRP
jgi:hypothetical protein